MATENSSQTAENPASPQAGSRFESGSGKPDASFAGIWQQIVLRLAEIREYAAFLLSAKLDAVKLAVRSAILYAVLGIVALLGVAAAVVTAVVLLLQGAAQGISRALNSGMWAGDLIVAVAVLAIVAIGARIFAAGVTRSSRRTTVEKYESRKRDQRARFGQDVSERAAQEQR